MSRFEYEILDDGEVLIIVNGRDKDLFTTKRFKISRKEITEFQNFIMLEVAFAWCDKFRCTLDEPKCK
jgi:hypothetical protein